MESCPEGLHVIHLALDWREALKSGLSGSSAAIGEHVGLSSGRVRQVVRLTNLHPKIVAFLQSLRGKATLRAFPERRLRTISHLPLGQQVNAFQAQFGAEIGF